MRTSPLQDRQDAYAERLTSRLAATVAAAGRTEQGGATARVCQVARVAYQAALDVPGAWLVLDYGAAEAEYAAIRRGAALIEWAQWGILEVSGSDATAFLDRLVTNAMNPVQVGVCAQTFITNRKGRIESDVVAIRREHGWWLQMDIACIGHVQSMLAQLHFGEAVEIRGRDDLVSVGVHGAGSTAALQSLGVIDSGGRANSDAAAAMRRDWLGSVGWELVMPAGDVGALWDRGVTAEDRLRPAGWSAANTARVEAGSPMFAIDFSTANLPAETSLLESRVSFTKGCYPGQEVVARMQHLGAPKQKLVGLRCGSTLPEAGDELRPADGAPEGGTDPATAAAPIGIVTSSSVSPMRGGEAIALAMVRSAHTAEGTALVFQADRGNHEVTVAPMCALPGGAP
ncbi:MAG: hypothetical protein O2819_09065 [Planctomycetota bacterium]|nr:hypothetical protein [Planctomycetota bacterium]